MDVFGGSGSILLVQPADRNFEADWYAPDTFFASTANELSVLLFLLGLGLVALGPGFIVSNLIQRTIPYLRTLQNRLNHPQGDQAFKQATKGLLQFSLGAFVLIYPLSILGGLNYYALSPDGVFYRPWFALHVIHYQWRQVTDIAQGPHRLDKPGATSQLTVNPQNSESHKLWAQ